MPFTFSHPAIVLPATYLPKKYYSLSGLIVGSMTPDFEYFIRMRDFSRYSHTWPGVFWFDIPLGLLIIFIFHNVVRNTLIRHLPFFLNVRFSVFEKFDWNKYFQKNILIVLISLVVGIVSHLVWDSFTHHGEYFADMIPLLSDKHNILNHNVGGAFLFQYISSVVGLIIMFIYILKFPEGRYTRADNILAFWLLLSLITVMVVNIRLYLDAIFNQHQHEDIIVTSISGAMIGVIFLSVFFKETSKRQLYKRLNKIKNRGS